MMCMVIMAVPSFARASDQIRDYTINVTTSSGWIDVEFIVTGKGIMSSLGCQSIYVYEKVGNGWSLEDYLLEDDDGMSETNSARHASFISLPAENGVEYKVIITIFADDGIARDSRSRTVFITGE